MFQSSKWELNDFELRLVDKILRCILYIHYSGLRRGTPLTGNESHELALLFAARSPDPALPGDEPSQAGEVSKLAEPASTSST